jgi:hypothetical protein
VLHHTATSNRVPPLPLKQEEEEKAAYGLARAIQRDHMNAPRKRWRDSGHHFLVTRGGLVLEGRNGSLDAARKGKVLLGAHSGDNRANSRMWGIETEGSYMESPPPPLAWAALVELCAYLSFWGKVDTAAIIGHRDVKATLCPGDAFHAALSQVRAEAHDRKLVLLNEQRPRA